MNKFVVFLLFVAVAYVAAMPSLEKAALRSLPALHHAEVHDEFNQYHIQYVTAEGTVVSEKGHLVPTPDGSGYVMIVEGEVAYIGDDGKKYVTKYTAGLDGFKVQGDHLPVAPEPLPAPEMKV